MYTLIISYTDHQEENELKKLCNNSLIHSISLDKNCIRIKTRKIWKLYWFERIFKKFNPTFCYYIITQENQRQKVPSFIHKNYKISIKNSIWVWQKTSIYFQNIHDVWKIRALMFFR